MRNSRQSDQQQKTSTQRTRKPASTATQIQTKLSIGKPDDAYEREADQVADQVVQMKAESPATISQSSSGAQTLASQITPLVQRKASAEEENSYEEITPVQEKAISKIIRRKEEEDNPTDVQLKENTIEDTKTDQGKTAIQRKEEDDLIQRNGETNVEATPSVEQQINSTKGYGSPMAEGTLSEMNQAFGADFSNVNIHTGSQSASMNQQIQAKAFTTGNDVYFNSGEYKPETTEGKRLLAHELTHTLQQGSAEKVQKAPDDTKKKDPEKEKMRGWLMQISRDVNQRVITEMNKWIQANPKAKGDEIEKAKRFYTEEILREFRETYSDDKIKSEGFDPAKIRAYVKEAPKELRDKIKATEDKIKKTTTFSSAYEAKYKAFMKALSNALVKINAKVSIVKSSAEKGFYVAQLNEMTAVNVLFQKTETKKYFTTGLDPLKFYDKLIDEVNAYPLPFDKSTYRIVQNTSEKTYAHMTGYAGDLKKLIKVHEQRKMGFNLQWMQFIFEGKALPNGENSDVPLADDKNIILGGDQEVPDPELDDDKIKKEEKDQQVKEFLDQIKPYTTSDDATNQNDKALLEQLKKMSPEDRKKFLEYLKSQREKQDSSEPPQVTPEKALEDFNKLSDLEKKILETNDKLRKDSTHKDGTDVMVDLGDVKPETDPQTGQTAQEALKEMSKASSVLNRIKKEAGVKGSKLNIDLKWSPFLTEMSMFYGMLAGAGKRSAAIKDLSAELMTNLSALRKTISKEILKSAALALVSAPGGPAAQAGAMALRLKKVKNLIDIAEKVYSVTDTAKKFHAALKDNKLQKGLESINKKIKKVEAMQAKMSEYSSLDDQNLEENLFQMEEQLREELIAFVAKDGDKIMEYLYIPELKDDSPEALVDELMKILYDLPKGLANFDAMYANYGKIKQKGDANEDEVAVLSLMAVDTGVYLYPFVGFLTQKANDALGSLNNKDFFSITGKKKSSWKRKKSKKPTKKGNKEKFARLDKKKYDYDKASELKYLAKYEKRFEEYLQKPENTLVKGYWTPSYFKYVARDFYKEIKNETRKETVSATDKKSKKKVKAPARLFRLTDWKLKGTQYSFKLKINPTVDVESLNNRNITYKTFKDAGGIPYTFAAMGTSKHKRIRKKEIKKWLDANGYKFTYEGDSAGKAIKTEPHLHIRRGVKESEYLHIDNGVIKQGLHTNVQKAYENFLGKYIHSNADLPEGYVVKRSPTAFEPDRKTISRKRKLPSHMKPLHWENGALTESANTKVPDQKMPLKNHKVTDGDYDYKKSIRKMFVQTPGKPEVPKNGYNMQKKNTIKKWEDYLDNHKDANGKKRPLKVEADLGYTVNARAHGDQLSQYKLPEMLKKDDNGHLVARRFGAVEFFNNLIPMDRDKNRKKDWSKLEHKLAQKYIGQEIKTGNYVHMVINISYSDGNTRRPSRFDVTWQEKKKGGGAQPAIPSSRGGTREVSGTMGMTNS